MRTEAAKYATEECFNKGGRFCWQGETLVEAKRAVSAVLG